MISSHSPSHPLPPVKLFFSHQFPFKYICISITDLGKAKFSVDKNVLLEAADIAETDIMSEWSMSAKLVALSRNFCTGPGHISGICTIFYLQYEN